MFIFGVTVVLYFIKILSGSRNFFSIVYYAYICSSPYNNQFEYCSSNYLHNVGGEGEGCPKFSIWRGRLENKGVANVQYLVFITHRPPPIICHY
jgi:hypothetical protein